MARSVDLPTLRSALWAVRALREARRELRRGRVRGARVSPPPALPRTAERGVAAVMRRFPSTCLERALVLQRWEDAHGSPRAVVIGVQAADRSFTAHAWLDGMPDAVAADYQELMRLPVDRA